MQRLIDMGEDLPYLGISQWNARTQLERIGTIIITATCRAR